MTVDRLRDERMTDERRPPAESFAGLAGKIGALALRTPGVYGISGQAKPASEKPGKGVRLTRKDKDILVNIHIIVHFGKPIPAIAREIQDGTKTLFLREYRDYALTAVNIWVEGVVQTPPEA